MVTVSASTKIHAFALAEQLQKHDLLDMLLTSYSEKKNTLAKKFIKRRDREEIPISKIKTNIALAIPIGFFRRYAHVWNQIFDKWASGQLKAIGSHVFIGWSGMSLFTIRKAKKFGMISILERGSTHILVQNAILKQEYENFGLRFSIHPDVVKMELQEYELADYISVPSSFVKNSFIAQGIPVKKLFVNPYGANEFFSRIGNLMKVKEGKFRIVYIGTLSIRKGLIYLFQALEKLKINETDYEVLFFGSIESELEPSIEKYRKVNWQFLGHVDHYRLPDYLASCDIGVQPSLEEGLSMVIPQMMACGIPVIVTPNTGGEDIVKNDFNGLVVPIRDPAAIAEKLEWAFNNPECLQKFKERAAASISQDFTWDAYGNRYADFLKKITENAIPDS